ncbi:MAG TPA: cupin-like domain-containing protein, partial [Sphingomicrobium sp.]
MRPIAEYEPMDRERFEREIVAKGEPAVFRGLVADWPPVRAARDGPEALAGMLRFAATDEPFQAWIAPPEVEGRFNFNEDFSGFNFERRLATIDQLLDLLLPQIGQKKPSTIYAGGIPIRKHLPALIPNIPVPMLDMTRDTLISLWVGNRTHTRTHWDQSQ